MKQRPILFSAPMVRAILDGRKTQTRRIAMKPVRHPDLGNMYAPGALVAEREPQHVIERCCPYGQPSDRLWVRETWQSVMNPPAAKDDYGTHALFYRATEGDRPNWVEDDWTWRPSIHMPRWASRIDLEVTGVRLERLQGISATDAIAEGIQRIGDGFQRFHPDPDDTKYEGITRDPVLSYRGIWEQINGPGSWADNPWVWVVEFKRLEGGAA